MRAISERLKYWFQPRMLADDDSLFAILETLATQFEQAKAAGTLTSGQMVEFSDRADKIQAELWRRNWSVTVTKSSHDK